MSKIIQKGYTVLTNTISGWELSWGTEKLFSDERRIMPDIYSNEALCKAEIAGIIVDQLNGWISGRRDQDEVEGTENYYIAGIEIDEQGNIRVYDQTDDTDIIVTTFSEWQKGR